MSSCYDVIIVGAGIAGLRVGNELLTRDPSLRCCILEKYHYTGGRVVTYHHVIPGRGRLQWENGAGRVARSHHRMWELIRRYGLTVRPLSSLWIEQGEKEEKEGKAGHANEAVFSSLAEAYLTPLRALPPSVLGRHTLASLLYRVYGVARTQEWIWRFPYYAEFHTLRADLALETLGVGGTLHSSEGFSGCVEGWSELVERMAAEFLTRGGVIHYGKSLKSVEIHHTPLELLVESEGKGKGKAAAGMETWWAHRVVLAMDATSLRSVHGAVSSLPVLRRLRSEPLLRIYAVFPVRKGECWFTGKKTTVLDSVLRFVIPVDETKGVMMISYSEGKDARHWMEMPPAVRTSVVMKELRRVFPNKDIPDPLFVKFHPWTSGCTYWLPGTYDPRAESDASVQPFERIPLFLCSESFAVEQSWMESALLQADKVVERIWK